MLHQKMLKELQEIARNCKEYMKTRCKYPVWLSVIVLLWAKFQKLKSTFAATVMNLKRGDNPAHRANKCKGWFWKQRETRRKYETCCVFSVSVSSFWEPIRTISWFSCNIGYKAAFYGMGPNFIFSSVVKKETTVVKL